MFPGENIEEAWTIDSTVVLARLHVDMGYGLSFTEASRRLAEVGPNRIDAGKKVSPVVIFMDQFISPFVLLLAIAAGLSFYFGEWMDGVAIIAVVIINAIIGFVMEFQAGRSMEALKSLVTVPARVIRAGKPAEVSSEEVVPGDILFVEGGDMIAADARLVKTSQLQADESALTGESLPVVKLPARLGSDVTLAERTNMLYKGTFVSNGNGYAVVVKTGMATELGNIARMVQQAEQAATPLEKKIQAFSKKLIVVTVALVGGIFVMGVANGQRSVEMLETSIALAVAAIPEGLPIVATLALALGMLRMARRNVIVKRLSAVETLGGTSVICTDKTGTLTLNRIEVSLIEVDRYVSGVKVDTDDASLWFESGDGITGTKAYFEVRRIAALCNTAAFYKDGLYEKEAGDPLEVGLLKMVYCSGKKPEEYLREYPRLDEVPFSSDAKVMATLHEDSECFYVAAKGALEEILGYCNAVQEEGGRVFLDDARRKRWLAAAEMHAENGMRVLAFAFKRSDRREKEFFRGLTLAGLVGFTDPPRPGITDAIAECKTAGIRVVMITGDHPATARNVARQLGLMAGGEEVMHGGHMKPYSELTDDDKLRWLRCPVFARVSPGQKLDLVALYQEKRMVVGMTGDGVNDAPALKKADIGIAMGLRGTQVAQAAADMVLKDDAFSSIVLAIRQGRAIFDNIRKFVIYLLSCNLSELLIIATSAVLNLRFQLLPLQILFINLVTDVLPALALGVTEAGVYIMERKPYSSGAAIVDRKRWAAVVVYSVIISMTTIGAVFLDHALFHVGETWDRELCNNILFYSLIFNQVLHVFNMSFDGRVSFFRTAVMRNKYAWYAVVICVVLAILPYWVSPLKVVLGVSIHGWKDWVVVVAAAFVSLIFIQLIKRMRWVI